FAFSKSVQKTWHRCLFYQKVLRCITGNTSKEHGMESILTVRLDGTVKEQATDVMRRYGYTPSSAVRRLFDYTVKHDELPFDKQEKPSKGEIKRRIAAFDACHTKRPMGMTDEEIRAARLEDRYGLGSR
ncbi:type II toxin-antitoxin system RelB/DinJ family antitoxin, partial [Gordonibacter sp.]|uniref:type II toxin-antitoxin system RelB/DinJ family antitoxin n=2 Tax=Gordonibacter sp. TaxID=1968902 RepID=UPI002FCAE05A